MPWNRSASLPPRTTPGQQTDHRPLANLVDKGNLLRRTDPSARGRSMLGLERSRQVSTRPKTTSHSTRLHKRSPVNTTKTALLRSRPPARSNRHIGDSGRHFFGLLVSSLGKAALEVERIIWIDTLHGTNDAGGLLTSVLLDPLRLTSLCPAVSAVASGAPRCATRVYQGEN